MKKMILNLNGTILSKEQMKNTIGGVEDAPTTCACTAGDVMESCGTEIKCKYTSPSGNSVLHYSLNKNGCVCP